MAGKKKRDQYRTLMVGEDAEDGGKPPGVDIKPIEKEGGAEDQGDGRRGGRRRSGEERPRRGGARRPLDDQGEDSGR